MRRYALVGLLVGGSIAAASGAAYGQSRGGAHSGGNVPGMRQAEIHNPFSSRYVDMQPNGLARRRAASEGDWGGGHGHDGHGHHHQGGWGGGYYPVYPWWGWGYYGGYPYNYPYYSPFGYAPILTPPEPLFGPVAAQRFLGFDALAVPPRVDVQIIQAPRQDGFGELAANPPAAPPKGKATNEEAKARARRFLALGDENFTKQRYADAYQRYRTGALTAPDLAEGYFRQAFAQIAMGRYDAAALSMRRGLDIAPDWATSGFRLDALYVDNQLAKSAHLESLAKASAADPQNADLLYLLGVCLYFDGAGERARPFFERVRQLGGDQFVAGFLKQLGPAPPAPRKQPVVGVEI